MGEPKLRFKADDGSDFPVWEDKTLGELFHISAGGDIDKNNCAAKQSKDYPYPVYANALVNNGTYGYANYYKIDGDTFTVTGRGDVGHAVARHCMYVPIVRLLVCQPNMDDDVDFFAEQINYTRVFIESTGVPQLTAPQLSKIKVKRPTLPEQRKIADCLSAVDAVIAAQQAEVDAWEQRKKGVMQKLFSQEVRFKADDGSDFPDWEEKTLGELGCFCSGVGFNERYQGHTDLPVDVYKVSDMNISGNEREMLRANNTVDESILKKMKAKAINQPSIIFAKVGAAIFAERKRIARKPFIVDNNMMVFTPNDENDFEYIYWLTLTLRFASHAQIGALPSYNASDISGFVVNIPSLPEQRKIADCLASLDDVIAKAKGELAKWQELKKGLLQQMFV